MNNTTIRHQPALEQPSPKVPTLRLLYSAGAVVTGPPTILRVGDTPIGRESPDGVPLPTDARASRVHARVRADARGADLTIVDERSTNGTFLNGRRVTVAPLQDGDVLRIGDSFLLCRHQPIRPADADIPSLIGVAPATCALRAAIASVATGDATVLLLGQSGTGKEVAAQAIHDLSARAQKPLCVLDCGATARELIESELFGHERGAFTGAQQARQGLFETAHGGTILLDELGELPLDLQPRLLRVLEQREIRRVGANRPIKIDVRILAATHRDLPALVAAGRFRGDLYARLAEISLPLPPLSERREDILPLLLHALGPQPATLLPDLVEALLLYAFPFNVREVFKIAVQLRTFAGGAQVLGLPLLGGRLDATALTSPPPNAALVTGAAAPDAPAAPAGSTPGSPAGSTPAGSTPASPHALAEDPEAAGDGDAPHPAAGRPPLSVSRDELARLVKDTGGNISAIARALGRSRRQIHRLLERHGLRPDHGRG